MSDSPEQQPSTGVLGRIGSWFSPWKGNAPKSPTDNASATSERPLNSDGGDESEESVKVRAGDPHRGEAKEQSSSPSPLAFARDIFPCEEQDATQSSHKRSSVVSSTEAEPGGPKEEESVACARRRIGQNQEWEESSNGPSASGNPEKNASHLTHLPSLSKQGVAQDSDQAHAQAQAQTGRRLHVYLEETCVTHGGPDTCAGQEVVRTEVTKNLKALTKANLSPGFDLQTSSGSTCAENKRADVSHAGGAQSYYSALTGVSLKSQRDSQLDPDADTEEGTGGDSMGRRNSSRRRHRKGSQGDGGNSPREKTPPNAQPGAEGFPPVASPQSKSPEAHMGKSPLSPASQQEPASPASPEGVESETSCPDAFEQLDKFQAEVAAETQARVVHGGADMEDNDRFYKVERKTETPESKRRSIKVSRSEVKLFTKNVPLNSKKSPVDRTQNSTAGGNTSNKGKDSGETDARLPALKKVDEELKPKPAAGRIADKISLFEKKQAAGGHKPIVQSPTVTETTNVGSDQGSRSAEGHSTVGPSSASPVREKLVSVKENFTESPSDQPQKTAMTGMSEERSPPPVTVSVPESMKLDRQGELDTTKLKAAVSEFTVKPDGQDTTAATTPVPKEPPPGSAIPDAGASKAETGVECKSAESEVSHKGTSDSSEMTNNICPESKGPSKTSSRPKRRKSKDPVSPVSPNTEAKPTSKLEITASKQTQAADTDKDVSASKPLTAKASSDKAQGNASDKQQLSDSKGKASEQPEVAGEAGERTESSLQMESTDNAVKRREDEPDTAAGGCGAKSDDKDPVVLAQREEKAGGQSLVLTQQTKVASDDSGETPASSAAPAAEGPIERTRQQEPSVEQPKLDQEEPPQPELRSRGKLMQPGEKEPEQTPPQNKGTDIINRAESRDVEKLKAPENESTNRTETKDRDQPPRSAATNITKDSDSGPNIPGTEGSVDKNDERTESETKDETRVIRDGSRQPDAASPSPETTSGSSDLCTQTHGGWTESSNAGRASGCAVTSANEAVSGKECDKGPLKGGTQRNVPPGLQTTPTRGPGSEKKPVASATEPQPNSVSLEKMENSPDDSHTRGARDEFSSSKLITKAATAHEEATVKATNGTPALITAQAGKTAANELSFKEPNPVSACESAGGEGTQGDDGGKRRPIKPAPSGVQIPRDMNERAASDPQAELLINAGSKRDTTSLVGNVAQSPCEGRAAEKTLASERVAVANGDDWLRPLAVKQEPVANEPRHAPKAPPSPEAKTPTPAPPQQPPAKKLQSPRGQSRDDAPKWRDTPSSWLDVDLPKRRQRAAEPKLSSSGSEGNILDTSGDLDGDDFVERIKKLCSPFSLPPRKHNHLRPPQPPFAMPAIKEDRFEKTFDPEEFTFGLRRKRDFTLESGPSLLAQLSTEAKSSVKPARASLVDRSMLLSGLDSHSRLREKKPVKSDEGVKEEKDDPKKVKSRLEGSCILNSLTSSRGKRNGLQTQVDGSISGGADGKMATPVSGAEGDPNAKPALPGCAPAHIPAPEPKQPAAPPQGLTSSSIGGPQTQVDTGGGASTREGRLLSPPPLSQSTFPGPTPTAPITDELTKQSPAPSPKEEAQAAEAAVCDSAPPLPRFNDIKLPDYLEKYLQREQVKPVQSLQGQEQVKQEVDGKMSTPVPEMEAAPNAKPTLSIGAPASKLPGPELKPPAARPQELRSQSIRPVRSVHKRPGKIVLFEEAQFGGRAHEIHGDAADATSLQLSPLISVKVVRGCWILYEKPDFQGRSIALEEGVTELTNEWAEPEAETDAHDLPPVVIGSIRLAVRDYSVPRIDLFTEPKGHGRVTPYHDDTIETDSFGVPLSTASIQVHSGVWLVFSDPDFQGMVAILEPGEYPFPESWGFPSPFVGSLRPLRMGCFKVEHPNEIKAVVYEKAHFEGSCLETDSDVFSLCEDEALPGSTAMKSVGSLRITGGLWVGYSEPGFEGQQYILEEGEYADCSDWGGSEQMLSLRPILADFMAPHLKMFTNKDFSQLGGNIDLTVAVANMDDTGYGLRTQSVEVIGGVWAVFEEPGFCGEPYILEKGLYGSPDDWGAQRATVASVMPVLLDDFESASKFKVQLFSDPGFRGCVLPLEDSAASLQDGFSFASCKVVAGSWVAFEGQGFTGRMYVLEAGDYPDLRAMGCDGASSCIRSLQTVGFEFSLPSVTLFERRDLRGKRVVLTDGSVNLQLAGGCGRVQSVLVEGATWILYERINFQGAQILLKPGEVLDWQEFSGWQRIGSLRPLIQKQVHFRLRNQLTGFMMSVTGTLDDVKLMRIQEAEESGGLEQIWFYQNGYLRCKLLEECCLSPSGSVTIAGSRTGLSPEPGMHLWSITPEGFIRYTPTSDLVLEVKGGHKYDKTQVILNSLDPNKLQQRWDVEVM
ncbi:beta/gamma crystallin domain-containing protein 1-like isoform X2 [Betta splendens]|uniref:Beta/gamma crystallin domain-containing protein 1-like isoform X2 n=1 Tax=Betta splendens TaxID=158456 RepID=A0A6P7LQ14_BETSP|nr:beta/gamma crystallin domain-containing protein 1-like isoform X2 [Betta splendens]